MFRSREHMSLLSAYEQARPNTRESLRRPVELAQQLATKADPHPSRRPAAYPAAAAAAVENRDASRRRRRRRPKRGGGTAPRAHGGSGWSLKITFAAVASRLVRIATATVELEGLSSAQQDNDRGTRRPGWQLDELAPFRLPIDSDTAGRGGRNRGLGKPAGRGAPRACRIAAAVVAGRALRRRRRRHLEA
jgi:hypothetical protein